MYFSPSNLWIFTTPTSQKVLSKPKLVNPNLQKRNYEFALVMKEKNKMVQRRCWIEKKNQSRVLTITSRFLLSFKIWMIFLDILNFYKKVTYGCDWVYVCSSNCLLKISFQFICHMQSLEWIQYFVNASWKFYSFK